VGTDGPNLIMGNAGNDTITGGNGNDTIIGGGGGDTLTGGGGIDTFKYTAITDSQHGAGNFDTIADFVHGTDKMDFRVIAGLTSVVVAAGAPGSVAAHTIEVVFSGSNTVVYANASGRPESTGSADMEVHLTGVNSLTAGDILHA
jgi:Ca2+-binding RTX toxin-like protein